MRGKSCKESLHANKTIKIVAWNVKISFQITNIAPIVKEMYRYHIRILDISNITDWLAVKKEPKDVHELFYSGRNDNEHTERIAILMKRTSAQDLKKWESFYKSLIKAPLQFKTLQDHYSSVLCPNKWCERSHEGLILWSALQSIISRTPHHNILMVTEGQNSKNGSNQKDFTGVLGTEAIGIMNNDGYRQQIQMH